jgi:hypothetical protein
MGRACNTHEEKKNVYKFSAVKQERNMPLRRLKLMWENNIKTDLREVGWGDMVWINLAQNRDQWRALVNMIMGIRAP